MPAGSAERRQISVLFCDVVSASAMSQQLDPEDLRDLLRDYQARCGEVLQQLDGYVAQYLGDGVLAYFGYPIAHEDDARRAVLAGLRMVRAVGQLRPNLTAAVQGGAIQVRVGVHTGPVVIGEMGALERREFLAVGETPNLAARLQAAAAPNSVVVSEATHRLARGYFRFRSLGAAELKGFINPVQIFEALADTGTFSRLDSGQGELAPLVGRESEFSFLQQSWRDAEAGKRPVVALSGEPGIGKSRLIRALREELAPELHHVLEAYCSPLFSNTALHPFVELIERQLRFGRDTLPAAKLRKLEAALEQKHLDAARNLPLLASLLSIPLPDRYGAAAPLSAQKERQALFDCLVGWVHALARERPVLFILEDLHWADASTLELVGQLIARDADQRLMVLMSHRPELRASWPGERVEQRVLTRMAAAQAQQIVSSVVKQSSLPPQVVLEVLAKADGVPLFLEEITKAVLELSEPAGERKRESNVPRMPSIPSTLQDSLNARLDRLGAGKPILQLASVIGRRFQFELLRAVAEQDDASLRAELDRLAASELLLREGTPPDETYVFKHALIRDSAYESLLRSVRQKHHREIAATLVGRFPELARREPELLARHYAGAGMAQEAVVQWGLAGSAAVARSAYPEAIHAYDSALEQLTKLPKGRARDRLEIDLRIALGMTFTSVKGYAALEVEEHYGRAYALCEQFTDIEAPVYGLMGMYLVRSAVDTTRQLANRLQRIVQRSGDAPQALLLLGIRSFFNGEYPTSQMLFDRARALHDYERLEPALASMRSGQSVDVDTYFLPPVYAGWCMALRATPQAGLRLWADAMCIAETLQHPFALALTLDFGAQILCDLRSDPAQASALSAREASIAGESGFPFWGAMASLRLGLLAARTGRPDEGIEYIQSGLAMLQAIGSLVVCPYGQSCLTEAYLLAGRIEDSIATADASLEFCKDRLANARVPVLVTQKAEALAVQGDLAQAERLYRQAIGQLQGQGSRLFELRASVALARVLRSDRSRETEARELLSPLCEALGSATDMPDLATARAMLDMLA